MTLTPDQRTAARALIHLADDLRLPRAYAVAIGWGESGLDWHKAGDGGTSFGLLQVHVPAHGHDGAWWSGFAGTAHAIEEVRPRWTQWARFAPSAYEYDHQDRRTQIERFAYFWVNAQGRVAVSVAEATRVLAEGEQIVAQLAQEQETTPVVDKPLITWIGCHPTNFGAGRSYGGTPITLEAVVIHTTDGGATIGALDSWFAQDHGPDNRSSAHFGIGPDGTIHQYVQLTDTAYAQGILNNPTAQLVKDNDGINPNLWCVSIELVDGGTPGNHTTAQIEAAARLTAWLFATAILPSASRTGAAVDRAHILGHYQFDGGNRAKCPSWSEQRFSDFVARVKALLGQAPQPVPVPADPRLKDAIDALTLAATGLDDLAGRADSIAAAAVNLRERAKLQAAGARAALAKVGG